MNKWKQGEDSVKVNKKNRGESSKLKQSLKVGVTKGNSQKKKFLYTDWL